MASKDQSKTFAVAPFPPYRGQKIPTPVIDLRVKPGTRLSKDRVAQSAQRAVPAR